jgi:hypothetical protein
MAAGFLLASVATVSLASVTAASAAVQTIAGAGEFAGVACPTASVCIAVGYQDSGDPSGLAVPVNPLTGVPTGPTQPIAGTQQLTGIACPSPSLCLAVGFDPTRTIPIAVPLNATTGAIAFGQSARQFPGMNYLGSVACPSTTQCLGVGTSIVGAAQEGAAVSLNPATGQITSGQSVKTDAGMRFDAVACPSSALCLAVGLSTSPVVGSGSTPGAVPLSPATGAPLAAPQFFSTPAAIVSAASSLLGLACPSVTDCVADGGGDLVAGSGSDPFEGWDVSLNPATGAPISAAQGQVGTSFLQGIACPSVSVCIGAGFGAPIDAPGVQVDLNPVTGLATQSTQDIGGTTAFLGVACATASACVGVGAGANETIGVTVPLAVPHATQLTATPAVLGISHLTPYAFTLHATLTSGGTPLGGQTVRFTSGNGNLCTATTSSAGVATCNVLTNTVGVLAIVLDDGYNVSYAGGPGELASSASAALIG